MVSMTEPKKRQASGSRRCSLDTGCCPQAGPPAVPPARGRNQVDQNAASAGRHRPVGFDASPDEVKAIKAGTETASVAQFPAKMGSLGIATLYDAVKGKNVPKNVDTGTALVTKANAAKFD